MGTKNESTGAARFTEGPWRVGETREFGRVDIKAMANVLVARVLPVTPGEFTEVRANAHLIAASPALYAALEIAAERLEYMAREGFGLGAQEMCTLNREAYAARAALAAARGEA